MISPGEEKAWGVLKGLDPSGVCIRAPAGFDENSGNYILRSFCFDYFINPLEKVIESASADGDAVMKKYGYFFVHSCLWYLISAKDIPPSGKLVNPENIRGGEIFFRGSHALPLESLAKKYGSSKDAFVQRGKELCAEAQNYGDVSIRLFPMPRIPVVLSLWLQDEEFPPRAGLFLDSSCDHHLPLDIIWSLSMLSVLVLM